MRPIHSRSSSLTEKKGLRFGLTLPILILVILPVGSVFGESFGWDAAIPFSIAPTGEFGGVVVPEFDRRSLNSQLVYQRRAALRMGWTPTSQIALWGEGGVGSLQLFENERILRGAYGPAVGGGWSYIWHQPVWRWWTPFVSGRATYLQSKLSDDTYQGSAVRSRRSTFEWVEYSAVIGSVRHWEWGDLQIGIDVRRLGQDEYRSVRTGGNPQKLHSVYSSGFQPGMALGANLIMDNRIVLWILAESSPNFQKLTIAIGQWGAPKSK